MRTFGHADCGVYGEVIAPAKIAVGDTVKRVTSANDTGDAAYARLAASYRQPCCIQR